MPKLEMMLIAFALLILAVLFFAIAATRIVWVRRLVFFRGAKKLFPPTQRERASAAANERRQFLRESKIDLERISERFPDYEILETPLGEYISDDRRGLSSGEAAAQIASLRWQLRDDAFLLLGRTIDLVTLLIKVRKDLANSVYQIDLKKVKQFAEASEGGLFPFEISIHTKKFEEWTKLLIPYRDWLNISILIQSPKIIEPFGRCASGGGLNGKTGGYLQSGYDTYQITCSHVLSNFCQSSLMRVNLLAETLEPDVAVLRAGSPCFPSNFNGHQVAAMDESSVFLNRKEKVFCVPGGSLCGVIESVVGWVTYSGRTHKFPHVQILPDVSMFMDIFRWPPSWINFSKPGDSGSWVIRSKTREWLGVLVAGNRIFRFSYVVLAAPLMDYMKTAAHLSHDSQPFRET